MPVALSPPRMPRTSETFGKTTAKKHVKAMKLAVQIIFLKNSLIL
jgi:hypothetical protein